jgi:hypothetical protein
MALVVPRRAMNDLCELRAVLRGGKRDVQATMFAQFINLFAVGKISQPSAIQLK